MTVSYSTEVKQDCAALVSCAAMFFGSFLYGLVAVLAHPSVWWADVTHFRSAGNADFFLIGIVGLIPAGFMGKHMMNVWYPLEIGQDCLTVSSFGRAHTIDFRQPFSHKYRLFGVMLDHVYRPASTCVALVQS